MADENFVVCFSVVKELNSLSGEATLSFSFCLSYLCGQILKIIQEQILPFKSRPLIGRALLCREANRKSQKLLLFVKMVEKHGGVSVHLKKKPQ